MGLLNLFKLEKLKVEVYGNKKRNKWPEDTFSLMFNPESYSFTYENAYNKPAVPNSSGTEAQYQLTKPSKLSLKIIIDGTGVSEQGLIALKSPKDVQKEVQNFLNLSFFMDGNKHEPKFLKVRWGSKLNFPCRLMKATVSYTLFDPGGNPLRAELDTEFISDAELTKRVKKENKTSPDLTHKRIVKEHDTLPLMCEAIYGTPDYYLQVAKANNLINFRDLKQGQELFFPPIKP